MSRNNSVADALKEVLERHSFAAARCANRPGKSWACEKQDIIWYVWLQASKYGGAYFVNLGLHLKAIPDPRDVWHAETRLETEMESNEAREELEDRLLNLHCKMPEAVRKARLVEIFERVMMPIFASCDTFESARRVLLADEPFLTRKHAKKFLNADAG